MKIIQKFTAIGLASLVVAASATTTPTTTTSFTPEQTQEINQQIQNFLTSNPKAVVDALVSYRQQEVKRMETQAETKITTNANDILNGNSNSPVMGNPNGSTVLVEFLDYQCGHCKQMTNTIATLIKENSDLKVIVKELPILGENSNYAAKVALAANQQGKFMEVHTALMNEKAKLTPEKVTEIAKNAGVDWTEAETFIASKALETQIDSVFTLAQTLNIMGTPAFIISNKDGTKNKFFGGAATQEAMQQTINTIAKNS